MTDYHKKYLKYKQKYMELKYRGGKDPIILDSKCNIHEINADLKNCDGHDKRVKYMDCLTKRKKYNSCENEKKECMTDWENKSNKSFTKTCNPPYDLRSKLEEK
jgi:hypothetical protein